MSEAKRKPEPYHTPGCKLQKVANYAKDIRKSSTWVYLLFQAGKINIVDIDGNQYVQILIPPTNG